MVEHPAGAFPRRTLCGFRVADGACHAWDLARAIGGDEDLDEELVRFAWDDASPNETCPPVALIVDALRLWATLDRRPTSRSNSARRGVEQ